MDDAIVKEPHDRNSCNIERVNQTLNRYLKRLNSTKLCSSSKIEIHGCATSQPAGGIAGSVAWGSW
jgi:hypothetical protein